MTTSQLPEGHCHRRADIARRVADLVRSDIHSGRFGEHLPYEWDLIRRYAVTRGALREALASLSDVGVLRRVPGVGTLRRVGGTAIAMQLPATALHIVDAEATAAGEIDEGRMQVETLAHERLGAPDTVAEALQVEPGAPVLFTESLIHVDGSPHRLRSSWIPLQRISGHEAAVVGRLPIAALREFVAGPLTSARFLIEALNADEAVAQRLGVAEGAALLLTERVIVAAEGQPIEFGFTRHRGDRTHFLADATE